MNAHIQSGFWRRKIDLVTQKVLPYQWQALNDQVPGAEPSHAVQNFRVAAGQAPGEHGGTIFQDSDLAKWLEAASYSLADHPDAVLEAQVDEAIALVAAAQKPDGYVNTWFTLVGPDKRWTDLPWGHELYCGGHFIEAAVAHHQATGKTSLLDVFVRYADLLVREFGPGGPHGEDVCGHPEIELALLRLADATGEGRFRDLAHHFVDVRGTHPDRFLDKPSLTFDLPMNQWFKPDYFVAHVPARHQHHADGHAVRAVYLYTAMAHQARQTGDSTLRQALDDLWTSVTQRRMYVTGGIGSQAMGERFTVDYDLPSDRAYTETCASIGLFRWGQAMMELGPHRRYADVMERTLFNGILSGMALDGRRFFYVNPLQSVPRLIRARQDLEHVKSERVAWFGCSCCPPNIARTVTSIVQHLGHADRGGLRIDQFFDAEGRFEGPLGRVQFVLATDYPWEGKLTLTLNPEVPMDFELAVRVPGWCPSFTIRVNGTVERAETSPEGYWKSRRTWRADDRIEMELLMPVRTLRARPEVADLAGQVAFARGPLIYCAEEVDNGAELHRLALDPRGPVTVQRDPEVLGGAARLQLTGSREADEGTSELYPDGAPPVPRQRVPVSLVPYHLWGNRRPGQEMRVWLRREDRP